MERFVRLHQKMDQTGLSESQQSFKDRDPIDALNEEVKSDHIINYKCANCILDFAKNIVAYLQTQRFLIVENDKILPTPLGKAAFASSINPEESMLIFNDLLNTRKKDSLVLETDLHLLYLLTPHLKNLREPNWQAFKNLFARLNIAELRVA